MSEDNRKYVLKKTAILDPDLQAVAEFMEENLPRGKIVKVAHELPALSKFLWEGQIGSRVPFLLKPIPESDINLMPRREVY